MSLFAFLIFAVRALAVEGGSGLGPSCEGWHVHAGHALFLVGRVIDQDPAYFLLLLVLRFLPGGWGLALSMGGWGYWANILGELLHACLGLHVLDLTKLLPWTCHVEGVLVVLSPTFEEEAMWTEKVQLMPTQLR